MDEQYEYRTGRTDPMKSSRGLIAVLLILVILLGGLVSALGIMNIGLFLQLNRAQQTPLSFAEGEAAAAAEDCLMLAGMALQEPDPVYQQLHDLPEGLYVAQVAPDSQAEKLGIHPGDVVVSLDKTPVSTIAAMQEYIHGKSGFRLCLWRDGREISLTLSQ